MLRLASLVLVGALGTISACGDDGGGGGGGDVAVENVGTEFSSAICPNIEMCFGPLAQLFLQGRTCEEFIRASYEDSTLPRWQATIAAGGATYDAAAMRACLDDIARRGCEAFDNLDSAPCTQAFRGTVAPGGACEATIECEGDAICRVDTGCPGTCAVRVAEGMPCTADQGCQGGLICDAGTCATPAGAGEPCEGGVAPECRAGLLCRGADDATMTAGTCTALSALLSGGMGDPCDFESGNLCSPELRCAVTDFGSMGVVTECRAPVASGAACFLAVPDMCPTGEACDADPMGGTFMGTCQALPGEGEPCASSSLGPIGGSCAVGLSCIEGTCGTFKRLGQVCAAAAECYSNACEGGVCVEPPLCE